MMGQIHMSVADYLLLPSCYHCCLTLKEMLKLLAVTLLLVDIQVCYYPHWSGRLNRVKIFASHSHQAAFCCRGQPCAAMLGRSEQPRRLFGSVDQYKASREKSLIKDWEKWCVIVSMRASLQDFVASNSEEELAESIGTS